MYIHLIYLYIPTFTNESIVIDFMNIYTSHILVILGLDASLPDILIVAISGYTYRSSFG